MANGHSGKYGKAKRRYWYKPNINAGIPTYCPNFLRLLKGVVKCNQKWDCVECYKVYDKTGITWLRNPQKKSGIFIVRRFFPRENVYVEVYLINCPRQDASCLEFWDKTVCPRAKIGKELYQELSKQLRKITVNGLQ